MPIHFTIEDTWKEKNFVMLVNIAPGVYLKKKIVTLFGEEYSRSVGKLCMKSEMYRFQQPIGEYKRLNFASYLSSS